MPINLLTDCVRLAKRRYDDIPHGIVHESNNIRATAVVESLGVEKARVSFEFLSVNMTMCWLPFVMLGSGTMISFLTSFNNRFAGKSCRRRL